MTAPRGCDALLDEYGDASLVAELAQLFLDTAESQLEAIRAATEQSDAPGLKAAAHRLRGALSAFGAASATDLALALESMGNVAELTGAPGLVSRLEAEVGAVCDDARAWLAGRNLSR